MNGSVLIIDDDTAFRFAMAKALRRSGYAVSEASSGEEAVEVLSNGSPPDVALLDLKMKGIGGLEVLRRCGAISTRVIVLTGHGTVKAAVEAMQRDKKVAHRRLRFVLPSRLGQVELVSDVEPALVRAALEEFC